MKGTVFRRSIWVRIPWGVFRSPGPRYRLSV
jgi:hypothetical protein